MFLTASSIDFSSSLLMPSFFFSHSLALRENLAFLSDGV